MLLDGNLLNHSLIHHHLLLWCLHKHLLLLWLHRHLLHLLLRLPDACDIVAELIGVDLLVTSHVADWELSLADELISSTYRNPTLTLLLLLRLNVTGFELFRLKLLRLGFIFWALILSCLLNWKSLSDLLLDLFSFLLIPFKFAFWYVCTRACCVHLSIIFNIVYKSYLCTIH